MGKEAGNRLGKADAGEFGIWFRGSARQTAARGDRLNPGLVRRVVLWGDSALRRRYGIIEFNASHDCIFRIAMERARTDIVLADGTRVAAGAPIGVLHLWGGHLPVLERRSPSLAWGAGFRWRMDWSFAKLARFMAEHPEWRAVEAIRADAAFASEFGQKRLQTLTAFTPFELVSQRPSGFHGPRDVLENCLFTALAWAFNPAIVTRQPFLRPRQELWISRRVLEARYGAGVPVRAGRRG